MGYTRRRVSVLAVLATTILIATAAAQAGVDPRGGRAQATPAASHDAVFDVRGRSRDRVTGTRRLVARRRGFLTGRSRAGAGSVALGYVRGHPGAFGLDGGDLTGLRQVRRYRFGGGATHLQWEQTYRGIPVFGTEVRANVDSGGRLINVGGAPLPDPSVASVVPKLSKREAVRAAGGGEGTGELVLFPDLERVRLAWRVRAEADSQHVWDVVVDANTGRLLYRRNLVLNVTALAFDNYPGAPVGGTQVAKDFPAAWLSSGTSLFGTNAHVYSDEEDDDNAPSTGDEIQREGGVDYTYTHVAESAQSTGQDCPATPGCSYNNFTMTEPAAFSWRVNRAQAGTQLFYFVNRFHDHLRNAPGIGFTAASGNFEGSDRVLAEVDNGASTDDPPFDDLPDCDHVNNADFFTLPDGNASRMQMYLWTSACPPGGVTNDVDGANDALIVYHEYTHGLSNRLVTDAAGFGALAGPQSSAMGEGWSDWYALDLLVAEGRETDTPAQGELRTGKYEAAPARTEPFDCSVGGSPPSCPGRPLVGAGGYTYGDFAKILGGAEEHADGEIWVQTLWDLRRVLTAAHGPSVGVFHARALVTDGMRLSPASPSFLDARNAILQADVNRGFGDRDRIWAAFAARGMGLNASTSGDSDLFPVEDFTRPPPLPQPAARDTIRPGVSRFSMSRRRFRVGRSRTPRTALAPRGSAFRFRLSEAATAQIGIHRALPGRRVGKRCRRPSRSLRQRRRCTRYVRRGTLTRRNLKAGSRRVSFSGRIGRGALNAGRHRATISATDAAKNRSRARRITFRIVRR